MFEHMNVTETNIPNVKKQMTHKQQIEEYTSAVQCHGRVNMSVADFNKSPGHATEGTFNVKLTLGYTGWSEG